MPPESTSFSFDVLEAEIPRFESWVQDTQNTLDGYAVSIQATEDATRRKAQHRKPIAITITVHPDIRKRNAGRRAVYSAELIWSLIRAGESRQDIQQATGCSDSTYFRYKAQMKNQPEDQKADLRQKV